MKYYPACNFYNHNGNNRPQKADLSANGMVGGRREDDENAKN